MSTGQPPGQWQPPGGWQQQPNQPPSGNWPPPPSQIVINGGDPDLKSRVTNWVFGQPAIVVLLFAGVFMFGWSGWYLMTRGIPAHLGQIQDGYERINKANIEARSAELTEVRSEATRRELLLREFLKSRDERDDDPTPVGAAAAAPKSDKGKPGT